MRRAARRTNYTIIWKLAAYFAAMTLLSFAEIDEGISPFHLGFYVALVFCGESALVLSPFYVAARVIAHPIWQTLVAAAIPPVVFIAAQFLHVFFKKRMTILLANVYALLSQLPTLFFSIGSADELIKGVVTVVTAQIFTYCCIVILFAVLVKGMRYRFTIDEKATALVLVMSLSLGLYGINIYGFRPFFVFLGFFIMAAVYVAEPSVAYTLGFSVGLGAGLAGGNIGIAGAIVFAEITAFLFVKYNIWFAAVSVILCDLLAGYFFDAFKDYDYLHIVALAIGVAAFLLVPRRISDHYRDLYGKRAKNTALKSLVNRNRADMNGRIKNVANIFSEMSAVLTEGDVILSKDKGKRELAEIFSLRFCGNCPEKEECFAALGSDTSKVLYDIVEASVEKGRATLLDVPTFITSRCRRTNDLLNMANELGVKYRETRKKEKEVLDGKYMLGEQMGSVAVILDRLADDIKRDVCLDDGTEKRMIEELSCHGVACNDVTVSGSSDGEQEVTLIIRESDAEKRAVTGVAEKILHRKLMRDGNRECELNGFVGVRLVSAPKYNVIFGVSHRRKDGSEASGDIKSVERLGNDRVMAALCDGMGSGIAAEHNAATALNMIENLYKAGFDNEIILNLVNRLLTLKNEENFSALDLCVLDLRTGGADFIKLGGVSGYIKRRESVEIIESSALPLGILEQATPHIERRVLMDNDYIVLVSDGVSDALGEEGIADIIAVCDHPNPQLLSDEILAAATAGGAADDSTAVALRLFLR